MLNQKIVFTAPGQVEVQESPIDLTDLKPNEFITETRLE